MLHYDFRAFLELLNKHRARYLVVGGYAVALYGYPRFTGDLDLFIALDESTSVAVVEALREFGFSDEQITPALFLRPSSLIEAGVEPLKLQIMNEISGVAFEDAHARRKEITLDGLNVPFISYDDLLVNKRATGRPKDAVDADELARRHAIP
jgi:predicted nucleotidyltransferase